MVRITEQDKKILKNIKGNIGITSNGNIYTRKETKDLADKESKRLEKKGFSTSIFKKGRKYVIFIK